MKHARMFLSDNASPAAKRAYDRGLAKARGETDALLEERDAERKRCTNVAMEWTKAGHIRLHAGEMTAQEMRSVKAVVRAIVREIQNPTI